MKLQKSIATALTVILTGGMGILSVEAAGASSPTCASITKAVVVGDGYTLATGPKITAYNYKTVSANQANALGTTIDFGAKALVVGCVSPADIAKLSVTAQGKSKPAMTATQYLSYMAKQSAGAMKNTPVGGVADYLDLGNGKEDGVGSTLTAGSIRLDAWVAGGKFIILTFSAPASATPSQSLLAFITSTNTLL